MWFDSTPRNHKFIRKEAFDTTDPAINVQAIITALQGAVTASDVVTLLASMVGVAIPFVLVWFGARTVINMFGTALTTGRLSIGGGRRRR